MKTQERMGGLFRCFTIGHNHFSYPDDVPVAGGHKHSRNATGFARIRLDDLPLENYICSAPLAPLALNPSDASPTNLSQACRSSVMIITCGTKGRRQTASSKVEVHTAASIIDCSGCICIHQIRTPRVHARSIVCSHRERTMTPLRAAFWAVLVLGCASLATAQDQPDRTAGMVGDRMMANCPMMGNRPRALDAIRAELGITDAQKSVWEGIVVAQLKAKVGMEETQKAMKSVMDAKSPVERLDARLAALELHLNSVREFKLPLEALYGALSAEQRKKADTLLADVACGM